MRSKEEIRGKICQLLSYKLDESMTEEIADTIDSMVTALEWALDEKPIVS